MNWTHEGLFFGIIPIMIDLSNDHEPIIECKYSWLEWAMDIVEQFAFFVSDASNTEFKAPIKITKEL